MGFDISSLKRQGFAGFVHVGSLGSQVRQVPQYPGVYVIVRTARIRPHFLRHNPAGRFKGRNNTVAKTVLKRKWVAMAQVLYIGRSSNLKRRLHQLIQFVDGKQVGKRGGRYCWQARGHRAFLVAWLRYPQPRELEAELVAEFVREYGRLPFANLVQPRVV